MKWKIIQGLFNLGEWRAHWAKRLAIFHCTCQHGGGLDVGAVVGAVVVEVVVEDDATVVVLLFVLNLCLANKNCSISSWCASNRSMQCRHAVFGNGSFIFTCKIQTVECYYSWNTIDQMIHKHCKVLIYDEIFSNMTCNYIYLHKKIIIEWKIENFIFFLCTYNYIWLYIAIQRQNSYIIICIFSENFCSVDSLLTVWQQIGSWDWARSAVCFI